jgi:phospholipid-binding lipoprotein MlaA
MMGTAAPHARFRWKALTPVALVLMMQGCASTPTGSAPVAQDPYEGWNRSVFSFNESLDANVIKPVATGYKYAVPATFRQGLTNFYNNFIDLWSTVNSALQGKLGNAGSDGLRVLANTTVGMLGLFDVATDMGIKKYPEDFGQTLGAWGIGAGPYVVWPILGPATVRDSFGLPLDLMATPGFLLIDDFGWSLAASSLQFVNTRANLLKVGDLLDDAVLDKYTFVRDAHLQRRLSLVNDGNVPESKPAPDTTP